MGRHVEETGVRLWLDAQGWEQNMALRSVVTSGYPNGPYSGPVFSKSFDPGVIELKGSNTWEGVYFVFIELAEYLGPVPSPDSEASEVPSEPAAWSRWSRGRNPFLQAALRLVTQGLGVAFCFCLFFSMRHWFGWSLRE